MYGVDIAVGSPNLPSSDFLHTLLHPGSLALWLVDIYLPPTPCHIPGSGPSVAIASARSPFPWLQLSALVTRLLLFALQALGGRGFLTCSPWALLLPRWFT